MLINKKELKITEEKIIKKIQLGRSGLIPALICFGIAFIGILANLIVMRIRGDTFAEMFIYIMYGYIAGFIMFFFGLILGIIFILLPTGELTLTDRRVYFSFRRFILFAVYQNTEKSIFLSKITSVMYSKLNARRNIQIVSPDAKINVNYRENDDFYDELLKLVK